jgi:CheY-like chemotaxis protein
MSSARSSLGVAYSTLNLEISLASGSEARVLIVDDVADVAEALACVLEIDGYSVKTAINGEQALLMAQEFQPHCVLLDISMPGMDGLELTKSMRQRYGDDVVLIAITGAASDDQRVSETFARVDHYLQKPIDTAQLRKVLPRL